MDKCKIIRQKTKDIASIRGGILTINDYNLLANKLKAGDGISIDENNVISASGSSIDESNLVHKTGDETIEGVKTFNEVFIAKDGAYLDEVDTSNGNSIPNIKWVGENFIHKNGVDEEISGVKTFTDAIIGINGGYVNYLNVSNGNSITNKRYVDEKDRELMITAENIENELKVTQTDVERLQEKVQDIELFKFPNATIVGAPHIQDGQVSRFTQNDYLLFPFLVDFKGRDWEINFNVTLGEQTVAQENILDSNFGLAFAVRNNKFVLAVSNDGETWNTGELIPTTEVQYRKQYYVQLGQSGTTLYMKFGYTPDDWLEEISATIEGTPYPRTIYIGRAWVDGGNHFTGSVNLNKATLTIAGLTVWQGMDDAGISTRADVSLSNLDDAGKEVINKLVGAKVLDVTYTKEEVDEKIAQTAGKKEFYFWKNDSGEKTHQKMTELRDFIMTIEDTSMIKDIMNVYIEGHACSIEFSGSFVEDWNCWFRATYVNLEWANGWKLYTYRPQFYFDQDGDIPWRIEYQTNIVWTVAGKYAENPDFEVYSKEEIDNKIGDIESLLSVI